MNIGRYQLRRELGTGGMATVYAAHDPMFERDVAIKLMPRDQANDLQFRQRFEREARTIAALEHIAIVPVYEYGEHEGVPYLVMRLMGGGSLSDRLNQEPLPVSEISKILRRVGGALDKAHANHIVHRDIKPANILFDEEGEPYISDFGIVKLAGAETLTATGGMIGTPAYMSPEQIQGQSDVDSRADIYSLGAVLFQMLTGRLPYESETVMGLALMHVTSPIPNLQEANPGLPNEYQSIISGAMAKERDQRFGTATDLAQAFEAANLATAGRSSGMIAPTVVETDFVKPKPSKNRRTLLIAGILIIIAAIIAGAVWLDPLGQPAEIAEATGAVTEIAGMLATEIVDVTDVPAELPSSIATETAVSNTPTAEPTAPPSPTATIRPTLTPAPVVQTLDLGFSTNGRPLQLSQVGNGPQRILLMGGMRGDQESTRRLVQKTAEYFRENSERVPESASLFFLPALNPDALAIESRYTPGGVDLNRNWDTPSWTSDAPQPGGSVAGSGGSRPFSEPETDALQRWLTDLADDPSTESIEIMNYYHHAGVANTGHVQPGYLIYGNPDSASSELAVTLSNSAGYKYIPTWEGVYQPTGEFINWSVIQGFAAVDVEVPPSSGGHGYSQQQLDSVANRIVESVWAVAGQ